MLAEEGKSSAGGGGRYGEATSSGEIGGLLCPTYLSIIFLVIQTCRFYLPITHELASIWERYETRSCTLLSGKTGGI